MKKNPKDNALPKILVLTGRAAEPIVRKFIPENVEIFVLPVDVAAFITSKMILENLSKKTAKIYDLIITPGLVQDDLTQLKDQLGVPIVKGPRYASDIKMAIIETDPFTLSPVIAADKYLIKQKSKISRNIIEQGFSAPLKKNEYLIGFKNKLPVGLNRPPLVMAEIVDAPKLSMEKITERALYYLKNGADILDIGAVANEPEPHLITKIIKKLKSFQEKHSFAISVDTLNVEEIQAAIKAGVELVLSIDHGNVEYLINDIPKDVGVVFVPTNVAKGYLPKTTKERVNSLLQLRDKLKEAGITKIAADPIIEMPIYPGFTKSLTHYIEYRKKDPETPMMTCVGNVTEFIAVDPIGINALFSCISVELGIQLLLVTDVSVKCRGGIKEIVKSRDLAFVAKQKNAPPKGHGIEILMAKSRTANDLEIVGFKNVETLEISSKKDNRLYSLDYEPDPKGSFTIWIDYHKQKIYVAHLKPETNKSDLLIVSSKARPIYEEILSRNLITKIDHAFYMGRELERAEICLYLGKTYTQNKQSFCNESTK
ncbi:MAG: dihydropteroate synthase-like protein [Candidatus Heimdallarchaeota archaeon]|nr:dihydropteroate synthase-like protein [Candidatus Heimdallarchaeota archaeon]MBY8994271.1 dihydropteroate synthase-like protein [Candidatus Heimdallarchaeota archaeon]